MIRTLPLMAVLLAGCAQTPVPPEKLAPPSPGMMLPAAKLPPVKKGDSLYEDAAVCRAEYGRVSTRLTGLQGYVRVIQGKKAKQP